MCSKMSNCMLCAVLHCLPSPTPPQDSLAPASVQPKYSFAPSTTINKMARPFTAGGASANSGPAIKPVAYSPKLNTPRSQGRASMQQPQNG